VSGGSAIWAPLRSKPPDSSPSSQRVKNVRLGLGSTLALRPRGSGRRMRARRPSKIANAPSARMATKRVSVSQATLFAGSRRRIRTQRAVALSPGSVKRRSPVWQRFVHSTRRPSRRNVSVPSGLNAGSFPVTRIAWLEGRPPRDRREPASWAPDRPGAQHRTSVRREREATGSKLRRGGVGEPGQLERLQAAAVVGIAVVDGAHEARGGSGRDDARGGRVPERSRWRGLSQMAVYRVRDRRSGHSEYGREHEPRAHSRDDTPLPRLGF